MKLTQLLLPSLLLFTCTPSQAKPSFLATELGSFAVLGASAVTNTGATKLVGNLGVSNNPSITGITGFFGTLANDGPGLVNGAIHQGDNFSTLAGSQLALTKSSLALLGPGTTLGADLTGLVLAPGTYTVLAGTSNLTGAVTLDGGGNNNAYWVFQLPSTLITSSASFVKLVNTGSGAGVYWNVGSSATLGANSTFEGNLLATASITMNSGVNLSCGRALAQTGAVTLIGDTVNAASCFGTVGAGSQGLGGGLSLFKPGGMPQILPYSAIPAIPEPATYAMLLAGIGLMGSVIKKRALVDARSGQSQCPICL